MSYEMPKSEDPRLQALARRVQRLQDVESIRRLQGAYGYYLDEGMWEEAARLFADDGTVEYGLDGVYAGRARVREYLRAPCGGKRGLQRGEIRERLLLMPVISLDADGQGARGTWRDIVVSGQLGGSAFWGEGPYENEYVKREGVRQIKSLHWFQTLVVPYDGGWARHDDANGGKYVSAQLPPDAPPSVDYRPWPGAFTPPFHFGPRGKPPASTTSPTKPAPLSVACLSADVQGLQDQIDIENPQQVYGYYIDKGLWTQASRLFARNGSLEVEGRGTFAGRARVLAYLRDIGPEGAVEGRLFDNMQMQPIVHVAADGKTARGRWRLCAARPASTVSRMGLRDLRERVRQRRRRLEDIETASLSDALHAL